MKTGGVIDLTTQTVPGAMWGHTFVVSPAMDLSLIDPRRPGELPLLRITVTASVVLAVEPY